MAFVKFFLSSPDWEARRMESFEQKSRATKNKLDQTKNLNKIQQIAFADWGVYSKVEDLQ